MALLKSFVLFLGKDLSSRSETDLDCIFGKRRTKKLAQVPTVSVLLSVCPHCVSSLGMKMSPQLLTPVLPKPLGPGDEMDSG